MVVFIDRQTEKSAATFFPGRIAGENLPMQDTALLLNSRCAYSQRKKEENIIFHCSKETA